VKPVAKPDAGDPHVRFDERGWETGRRFGVSARAHPRLYTNAFPRRSGGTCPLTPLSGKLCNSSPATAWSAGPSASRMSDQSARSLIRRRSLSGIDHKSLHRSFRARKLQTYIPHKNGERGFEVAIVLLILGIRVTVVKRSF
jgi:hypothetical protein